MPHQFVRQTHFHASPLTTFGFSILFLGSYHIFFNYHHFVVKFNFLFSPWRTNNSDKAKPISKVRKIFVCLQISFSFCFPVLRFHLHPLPLGFSYLWIRIHAPLYFLQLSSLYCEFQLSLFSWRSNNSDNVLQFCFSTAKKIRNQRLRLSTICIIIFCFFCSLSFFRLSITGTHSYCC
jgi:hypothetical protein